MDDPDASNFRPTPDYDENGVDLSLVRQMLNLTPGERLQYVEERNAALMEMLRALSSAWVQFIVVGGSATCFHGGWGATQALEVVVSPEPANVDRIAAALKALEAVRPWHPQHPTSYQIGTIGNLAWTTRFGRLKLLAAPNLDYSDLLPHTVEMWVDIDLRVRVLDQETNVSLNKRMGWDPDLAALHMMRATLKERRRRPH
jgi:hypothetical protein